MKSTALVKATLIASAVALAAIAGAPTPSHAAESRNTAAAAAAIGGFAAGAALGAAAQPRYVERGYPVHERRVVVEDDNGQECFARTRRVFVNGVPRLRRVTVCE